MASLVEWMDVTELGDYASILATGWQDGGFGGISVVTSPHFTDLAGNGGAYALQVNSDQFVPRSVATKPLATPVNSFYEKFHFYFDTFIYGSFTFLKWRKGSTVLGRLTVNAPSGTITMESGEGANLLGTSIAGLAAGVWKTIEIHVVIGTSGQFELRVDGFTTNWLPLATGNTKPGADTTVDNIDYHINAGPANVKCIYDDIEADDAAYPKEGIATILVPTGAGNTTQFTPLSGANWQNVDEVPANDADYNSTLVANIKDTYTHTALPVSATNIKNVLTVARLARAGSGITHAYLVTRSGGTDYESAAKDILITPSPVVDLRSVDPATGVAWTRSGVNAAELGVRVDV